MALSRLTAIDALLGFQHVIEATWFYKARICPSRLQESLDRFLSLQPTFAATAWQQRPFRHPLDGWRLGHQQAIKINHNVAVGTSLEASAAYNDPGSRYIASFDGESVMQGHHPCMSVALTSFEGGGSALGVAISHGLVDAHGFHHAMAAWSRLHEADMEPARELTCSRMCIDTLLKKLPLASTGKLPASARSDYGATSWDMTTWRASALWSLLRVLGRGGLQQRPRRALLRFSADELRALKRRGRPAGDGADGGWRPSTYEALAASLCGGVARLLGLPIEAKVRLHVPVNMRPYARLPRTFTGNAFHLLSSAPLCVPPHAAPMWRTCLALRELTAPLRDDPAQARCSWLEQLARLSSGYMPLERGFMAATSIFTNFQAKLPMLGVTMGAGPPIRVVPGAGDTIHMVPAPAGAVDALINLPALASRRSDWIAHAESVEFKAEVLDGRSNSRG